MDCWPTNCLLRFRGSSSELCPVMVPLPMLPQRRAGSDSSAEIRNTVLFVLRLSQEEKGATACRQWTRSSVITGYWRGGILYYWCISYRCNSKCHLLHGTSLQLSVYAAAYFLRFWSRSSCILCCWFVLASVILGYKLAMQNQTFFRLNCSHTTQTCTLDPNAAFSLICIGTRKLNQYSLSI